MKRLVYSLLALCLMAGMTVVFDYAETAILAQAQAPATPPRVLRIFREEVKAGMADAHNRAEMAWPRAFSRANSTDYYVAMTSLTGPTEAWFVSPYDSYEELETLTREQEKNKTLSAELEKLGADDNAFLTGARSMVAIYNPDLSRPSPDPFPLNRYVVVTTYRVRPGKAADYREFRQLIKKVNEDEKTSTYFAIFNVASGAPNGTFLMLRGLKSLKELDPVPNQRTFAQLLGADRQKKLDELASSFMISAEASLFRLQPEMSYPPKEFLAVDAAFWGSKTTTASALKGVRKDGKKEVKKAAPGQ